MGKPPKRGGLRPPLGGWFLASVIRGFQSADD